MVRATIDTNARIIGHMPVYAILPLIFSLVGWLFFAFRSINGGDICGVLAEKSNIIDKMSIKACRSVGFCGTRKNIVAK